MATQIQGSDGFQLSASVPAVGSYTTLPRGYTNVAMKRFGKRANSTSFYGEADEYTKYKHHPTAPIPGYTGCGINQNRDYGNSKAFGLKMQVTEVPQTPKKLSQEASVLLEGFGPTGKHTVGQTSLFAGLGKTQFDQLNATDGREPPGARERRESGPLSPDRIRHVEHYRLERITGMGRRAPFDFVAGDGLVQECHDYCHTKPHLDPVDERRGRVAAQTTLAETASLLAAASALSASAQAAPHRLRRTRGAVNKGYAPVTLLPEAGSPGTIKYSIFQLPTLREVAGRKTFANRV